MNKSLAWIRQLDNVEDMIDKDAGLVYEHCGLDVFIALWEGRGYLPSISIYLSAKSLDRLRRRYIKQYFNGSNQMRNHVFFLIALNGFFMTLSKGNLDDNDSTSEDYLMD